MVTVDLPTYLPLPGGLDETFDKAFELLALPGVIQETAQFLFDAGYGSDFSFAGLRPPLEILEKMVELAADDEFWVLQENPREMRLEEAYFCLSAELGDWRGT